MKIRSVFILLITIITIASCSYISTPFTTSSSFNDMPEDTFVIASITFVELKKQSEEKRRFWNNTSKVAASLANNDGYLGHRIRRNLWGTEGWTMTLWENEHHLNAFISSATHKKAMMEGVPMIKNARFLRLKLKKSELPLTWQTVRYLVKSDGRSLYDN